MLERDCNDKANTLREDGRKFYDDKYKGHFDNLISRTGDWFRAMGDDPLNKRFGEDLARLTKDLLFDGEGSLKFKSELWMDIRKVILPSIIDQVRHVYLVDCLIQTPDCVYLRSDMYLSLVLNTRTTPLTLSSRTWPCPVVTCSPT